MKYTVAILLSLGIGISIGWYFGYTRPALHALHMTQEIQKATGMSEEQMLKAVPENLAALKREDESTATVALRGVEILNRGDTAATKKYLAYWVGSYYRVYHSNGDTNLIARIQQAATTTPEIAAEVSKKIP